MRRRSRCPGTRPGGCRSATPGAPQIKIATAAGTKTAYRINLATVRVGDITLHNVDGLVMEGGKEQLPITLIGMSFLNGVEMRRIGDTLTLTRRNF